MAKATTKSASKTPRIGRSAVTGRFVLLPATKSRSISIDRAKEVAREVAGRKS